MDSILISWKEITNDIQVFFFPEGQLFVSFLDVVTEEFGMKTRNKKMVDTLIKELRKPNE